MVRAGLASAEKEPKQPSWWDLCQQLEERRKQQDLRLEAFFKNEQDELPEQEGDLWCSLATHLIRLNFVDRAREIYEEGLMSVFSLQDLLRIFNTYTGSEYNLLRKLMSKKIKTREEELELELGWTRYESLGDPVEVVRIFSEAVHTIDPRWACEGQVSQIWIAFAQYYESRGQIDDARVVFKRAPRASYSSIDELVEVWCEYAKMELRNDEPGLAIAVCRRALDISTDDADPGNVRDESTVELCKKRKLLKTYTALEGGFGLVDAQMLLNVALFFERRSEFDAAFRFYEGSIGMSEWPEAFDIWSMYLTRFMQLYGRKRRDLVQELFAMCFAECPPEWYEEVLALRRELEDSYGLRQRTKGVCSRAEEIVKNLLLPPFL
ncbi:pre-mRNA-splicing factor SYF1-like [Galendromus occidentalis]|uniref:Pre-mRNA-splicing factor SYF1-like n=1 Tax=Galendromus occidentalis TaxID=34638 RepID=A0AAJ6QWK5_9ACAR|nr:pre-mRNA-splicing factor SYF1-like [Galendromus occidentalis]